MLKTVPKDLDQVQKESYQGATGSCAEEEMAPTQEGVSRCCTVRAYTRSFLVLFGADTELMVVSIS